MKFSSRVIAVSLFSGFLMEAVSSAAAIDTTTSPRVACVLTGTDSSNVPFTATIIYQYNWNSTTSGFFDYKNKSLFHFISYSINGGATHKSTIGSAETYNITTSGNNFQLFDLKSLIFSNLANVEITIPVASGMTFPPFTPPQASFFPTTGGTFVVAGGDNFRGNITTIKATQTTAFGGGGPRPVPSPQCPPISNGHVRTCVVASSPDLACLPRRHGILARFFQQRCGGR